jgi:putative ABC transport system substrate-binding protein
LVQSLALAALTPSVARGQTPARTARLGVLLYSDPRTDPNLRAFRAGMRDLGWVEGHNLAVDFRGAEGRPERLPELARELVRARPDALFVLGGDVVPAAATATSSIPIVAAISNDPVRSRLIDSLARPGGNVTGCTSQAAELAAKRLQLLKEAASRIASRQQALVDFAARDRLRLAGGWGAWADRGALPSYGADLNDSVLRAADYVDRVLKGARPADLPFRQPTKVELVVNLKTAKALGLTAPPSLLARADRVIE